MLATVLNTNNTRAVSWAMTEVDPWFTLNGVCSLRVVPGIINGEFTQRNTSDAPLSEMAMAMGATVALRKLSVGGSGGLVFIISISRHSMLAEYSLVGSWCASEQRQARAADEVRRKSRGCSIRWCWGLVGVSVGSAVDVIASVGSAVGVV